MTLKILDLFSGLGGFSLGLERTGHFKTIAFCDNNKYCNLVLQKHWKGVKIYNDVKEITKERLKTDGVEAPDIITGGFPCQSFSVAGKRKGTDDPRYLWPEMFRIIQEFTPRWVIGENVKGLTNIQDGMVFETVCTDLEGEGYEVRAFNIPAAGVGAPHRRERIWIVAHAKRYNKTNEIRRSYEEERRIQEEHRQDDSSSRLTSRTSSIRQTNNGHENVSNSNNTRNRTPEHEINKDGQKTDEGRQEQSQLKSSRYGEDVENSRRTLQQGTELGEKNEDEVGEGYANQHQRSGSTSESNVANAISRDVEAGRERQRGIRKESQGQGTSSDVTGSGETKRTEKKLANTNGERLEGFGQSSRQFSQKFFASDNSEGQQRSMGQGWWSVEPNVGRVAHGVSGRVHRLKGLGNSIVPQIVEEIGYAIIKATERK
jgi:DNA (cytosine-5)-methyltransferase 1